MLQQGLAAAGLFRPPTRVVGEVAPIRTPILPAPPRVRGTVHIDVESCKGCELCVNFCPTQVLALSSEYNGKGYHYPVIVAADGCIACRACTTICPDYAIFVLPSPA